MDGAFWKAFRPETNVDRTNEIDVGEAKLKSSILFIWLRLVAYCHKSNLPDTIECCIQFQRIHMTPEIPAPEVLDYLDSIMTQMLTQYYDVDKEETLKNIANGLKNLDEGIWVDFDTFMVSTALSMSA